MDINGATTGDPFSRYRLLQEVGEGGMGVVYAAEDTHLRRPVAIKFLNAGLNRRTSKARFLREARAASVLNHPNIATVYDYGETGDGRPFIVMELLGGETLADLLRAGTMSLEQSVGGIVKVLEALAEAHRHGIVHRDIKPSNVMVGERGQVKVLDFGLAKLLGDEVVAVAHSTKPGDLPTQTLSGAVLGTPLYVSPEQATGVPVDQRGDLFSVGAVLYECLAGRPAFGAPSVVEIFAQVISPALPPPPSKYNPSVTSALDRVTLKSLAKSPESRYQSAEEFLKDLRKAHGSLSRTPQPKHKVLGSSLDLLYRKIVSRGGEERAPDLTAPPAPARARPRVRLASRVLTVAALVSLLLVIGARSYLSGSHIDSVAILPFANATQDESVEYLGDGFSESLISSLSRLPDVRVISRNSVTRYKGQAVDPAAVGAELNVRAVLTGRIIKDAGQLIVEAELIDVRDRTRLWGGRFDLSSADAFSAQQQVVRGVLERVRGGFSAEHKTMASKRPSADPEAYYLYVKGRWYWNKMTIDGARQAVSYFQQAIDKDPNFALAYVGIAETYMLNSWVPANESYLRAKAAASKALELDDSLGEAHATLGYIKTHYERDWGGAEEEFTRAIELSPNHANAHLWYADNLMVRGRIEEYYREIMRARELDPLSPLINADVGMYYLFKSEDDRAIEEFKRAQVLFPDFYTAHFFLGYAYSHKGLYQEAIAEYRQALELSGRHSLVLAALGHTYGLSGDKEAALRILRELEELKKERNVSPYRFAVLHAGLGNRDEAFQWLDRAFEQNDIMLIYVNVTPFSDPLRGDPRFDELIRRMGLTPR